LKHRFINQFLLVALTICSISCGSATFYHKSASGSEYAAIAPGLLSKQMIKDGFIKTPNGLVMGVNAYASRQPDPDVTSALRDYGLFKLAAPIIRAGVDGANAVNLKEAKDPNIIPKNPNIIPKDPNIIPADPNIVQ
jgi:hypothetical protein